MIPFHAVACDLFGTLVRLPDPWLRRRGPELLGVPGSKWLAAVRRVGLRQAFPTVEALVEALARAAGVTHPQGQERLVSALAEHLAQARLVPGALGVLRFLRQRGLKLALVSNLSSAHTRVAEALGLNGLFDAVLFSCELNAAKPEPAFFHRLSASLGLEPSQVLVVGDSAASDGKARRFGFPVLLVGSAPLPTFFALGWLAWEGGEPRPLLAEGLKLPLGSRVWRVQQVEPLAEGQEGRYNLLAVVTARDGEEQGVFFCKRFWDPASAYVDTLARSLARSLGLPVPRAWVVEGPEPVVVSRAVVGRPCTAPLTESVAFDLGAHLAFAYAFANADIRPRNALVTDIGGRERLVLIDFEHCFLNLALPPEVVGPGEAPKGLAGMTLETARQLAQRQVITPKTIVRARNEFFPWREASPSVREAMARGFSRCWERMQARAPQLVGRLRRALDQKPPLRVGTWRFRRQLAAFDVEEVERRLQQPCASVLPLFLAEAHPPGGRAPAMEP